MVKPKALGIIPARGNSKRLLRKNIKKLLGKPLIAYTIEAAQKSKCLTDFLVTTEDEEIYKIANDYGAPTPFIRPQELSGDDVRNIETVNHAFNFMEDLQNIQYDILVLLQPTCPIRDPQHIDDAITKLWNSDLDTAVSVKGPFKKRDPILKAIRNEIIEDYANVDNPSAVEPFYLYNASIYAVKRSYFIDNHKLISSKQVPILMDVFHSTDIDDKVDFLVAETFLKYINMEKNNGKE
jgi:CMP-N,N'-diacetyllegionaminic acid synthase